MRSEFAALVNPIFQYVLSLDERIRQGTVPLNEFDAEKLKIRQLVNQSEQDAVDDLGRDFAIAKRALIYWADEILHDSDQNWGVALEWEFFQTDDRATLFYIDFKQSAAHASNDVLETYYLAVVLGFKGTIVEAYRQIGADGEFPPGATDEEARVLWAQKMAQLLPKRQLAREPAAPALAGNVEPLKGSSRLTGALIWCAVLGGLGLILLYVQTHLGI